ncbi:MAG: FxsA family protein [Acidimicrobiia bacterium]
MRLRTWLFLGFIIVPIIEIVLFYLVGSQIGIWWTLLIVVITAFVGSWLVSRQGRATWQQGRQELEDGGVPTVPLVNGAMILVAGALLLTPGFLTDIVGLSLLVPSVRDFLRKWGSRWIGAKWVVLK